MRRTGSSASPRSSTTSTGSSISPGARPTTGRSPPGSSCGSRRLWSRFGMGGLCLTTVIVLARVMTEANRHEVLPRFFGLSRQEAEQVAVEIRPVEVVPRRTVVTEAPVSRTATAGDPADVVVPNVKDHSRSIVELAPARTLVEPLTRRETRIHITVSPEFLALLKKAKAGQSHRTARRDRRAGAHRGAGVAHREAGEAAGQRAAEGEAGGVKRDGGKCTWPLAIRRYLRRDGAAGGGPRRPAREGRPVDGGQLQDPLQTAQPRGCAAGLRRRGDGPVHPGWSTDGDRGGTRRSAEYGPARGATRRGIRLCARPQAG